MGCENKDVKRFLRQFRAYRSAEPGDGPKSFTHNLFDECVLSVSTEARLKTLEKDGASMLKAPNMQVIQGWAMYYHVRRTLPPPRHV